MSKQSLNLGATPSQTIYFGDRYASHSTPFKVTRPRGFRKDSVMPSVAQFRSPRQRLLNATKRKFAGRPAQMPGLIRRLEPVMMLMKICTALFASVPLLFGSLAGGT